MPQLISHFRWLDSAVRRFGLSVIGSVLVVDLIWFPFSAMHFNAGNLAAIAAIAAVFLLAGPLQRRYEFSPATRHLAVEIYLLILFGAAGFVFSYLVIEAGWTDRDDFFVAIDLALGFDWRQYTSFVLQHDWLRPASMILYVMTPMLVGVALVWCCLNGKFDRASELVAMVILGGVLCVVISGVVPTVGGSGYFPSGHDFYGSHKVIFDDSYKELFFQLRDGAGMKVSLLHPVALIAFPSYHACLALLLVLVFWNTGKLAYTIFGLNLGSLLSLPVQGGHHLSDVLGGLLVGAATYWTVRHIGRRDRVAGRPDIGSQL